jgi:hypothetical protein
MLDDSKCLRSLLHILRACARGAKCKLIHGTPHADLVEELLDHKRDSAMNLTSDDVPIRPCENHVGFSIRPLFDRHSRSR